VSPYFCCQHPFFLSHFFTFLCFVSLTLTSHSFTTSLRPYSLFPPHHYCTRIEDTGVNRIAKRMI